MGMFLAVAGLVFVMGAGLLLACAWWWAEYKEAHVDTIEDRY